MNPLTIALTGFCGFVAAFQWDQIVYRLRLFYRDYNGERYANHIGDGDFPQVRAVFRPIPTGLDNSARRCAPRATPGSVFVDFLNPERVAWRCGDPAATPLGLRIFFTPFPG